MVLLTLGLTVKRSLGAASTAGLGRPLGRGEGDKDEGEVKKKKAGTRGKLGNRNKSCEASYYI